MFEGLRKEFTSIRILVTLLTIAVSIYLLQILFSFLGDFSDIILVLLFSWLFSFALDPVVDWLSRYLKLTRFWAAFLTYILVTLLLIVTIDLYIPTIATQITKLADILPAKAQTFPPFLTKWLASVTHSLDHIVEFLPSIAQTLFLFVIVLLLSFYFLIDKEKIKKETYELTPKKWHKNMAFIENVINSTFGSFLRIQLIFAIMSGIATYIVMAIAHVEFAASSALFAGILTFIPLIGPVLALIPPFLAAFINNQTTAVIVVVILFIIQQIEFNIIGPRLMGRAFKLHPAIVLLSFLVGYKLWGGIGAVFAVPILGIIVVIFREFGHYFFSGNRKG